MNGINDGHKSNPSSFDQKQATESVEIGREKNASLHDRTSSCVSHVC